MRKEKTQKTYEKSNTEENKTTILIQQMKLKPAAKIRAYFSSFNFLPQLSSKK